MRTISPGLEVRRYVAYREFTARGDPFDAVLVQLGFLRSRDYVAALLTQSFGVSTTAALARTKKIIPHVDGVLAFADQARRGPQEVSFLPSYYAALNLLKLYILFSARHADLAANRWHGAQYKVETKDSRSLLTDEIHLKNNGAIQLFYEVLTGQKLPTGRAVAMKEIYPFIADAAAEWELATGKASALAGLECSVVSTEESRQLSIKAQVPRGSRGVTMRQLPALRAVKPSANDPLLFESAVVATATKTPIEMARDAIKPLLVYYPYSPGTVVTPVSSSRILMFEELPIVLALFHMGSVVRYKPEFVARLRDSRYWPLLMATANDALFRLIVLFWSYATQTTIAFTKA